MTDVNSPTIVAPFDAPNGAGIPINVVATATTPGTPLHTATNDPNYRDVCTLEVGSISTSSDFWFVFQVDDVPQSITLVPLAGGAVLIFDAWPYRNGARLSGVCLAVSGGAGTAGVLIAKIQPLRYLEPRK